MEEMDEILVFKGEGGRAKRRALAQACLTGRVMLGFFFARSVIVFA